MQDPQFTAHIKTPKDNFISNMTRDLMAHAFHLSRLQVTLSPAFFDPRNPGAKSFIGVQMPQLTSLVMLIEPNPAYRSELQFVYTEAQFPALKELTLNGIGLKVEGSSLANLVHLKLYNYPDQRQSMSFAAFLALLNTGVNLTTLALSDYLKIAHHEEPCHELLKLPKLEKLYVYDAPGSIARFLSNTLQLPFCLTIGGEYEDGCSLECSDNLFLSMLPPGLLPPGQNFLLFLSLMTSADLELNEEGIRIDCKGHGAQCTLRILLSDMSDMSDRKQFKYRALFVAAARAVLSNTSISALKCSGGLEGVGARAWLELFSGTPLLRELTLVDSGRAVSSFFHALGMGDVPQGQYGADFKAALMHYGGPRGETEAEGWARVVCPRLEKVVLRGPTHSTALMGLILRTLKLRLVHRRLKTLELVLEHGRGGIQNSGEWQTVLLECAEEVMIAVPIQEGTAETTPTVHVW